MAPAEHGWHAAQPVGALAQKLDANVEAFSGIPSGEVGTQLVSIVSPMVGGLGVGFFGCLLSYSRQLKKRLGRHTGRTRCAQAIATVGSFTFSLFSLVPLALGGPINTVNIVRAGALLPANAFFSQFFGLRPLLRDDYIGTLVTVSGVVCFIMFVGPPSPEKTQDEFLRQIGKPVPLVFLATLLSFLFGSAGWMLARRKGRVRHDAANRMLALAVSVVISCSIAAMDIATKGWGSAFHSGGPDSLESPFLWTCFLIQALFFVVSKWGMIYGCSRCDVLIFVPLNIVLNIFFAVAAGVIVLGEGAQVASAKDWCGLTASCVVVASGILLLVTGPADSQEDLTDPNPSDSEGAEEVASTTRTSLARQTSGGTEGSTGSLVLHGQTSALARLNRLHIRAEEARHRWREHVFGHLRAHFIQHGNAAETENVGNSRGCGTEAESDAESTTMVSGTESDVA